MWEHITEKSRQRGPIRDGCFRVVTIESDARLSSKETDSLKEAQQYADDAASEADTNAAPVALVLNHKFEVVYKGRPYFARGDD